MSKQYVCPICGGPNTKQRAWKQKPCSECALKRSHAAVSQLHNKSGPLWEKWIRNWKAATGLELED